MENTTNMINLLLTLILSVFHGTCDVDSSSVPPPNFLPKCPVGYFIDANCLLECEQAYQESVAEAQTKACYARRRAERIHQIHVGQAATQWIGCMANAHTSAQMQACENDYDWTVFQADYEYKNSLREIQTAEDTAIAEALTVFLYCALDCCVPR